MGRLSSRIPATGLAGMILFIACLNLTASSPLSVNSPDGNITVAFEVKSKPQPYLEGERAYYRVSYKGNQILMDSPLGLDFEGMRALDRDFEIAGSEHESHDSTWENPLGTRRKVRDHYNQLTVSLRERRTPGRRVDLVFRAYDEGVAFRYFLPRQENLGKFTLLTENTGFYFAHNAFAYALNLGRFNTSNEGEYWRVNLDQIKPASIINLPLLVELPGGPWVGLLEADLTDYAGMYVGGVAGIDNALVSKLSPLPPRMDRAVVASTPKATPWRVLLISDRPGALIENNWLILNLSAPSALGDTSWIKPGKSAWDWWSGSFAKNVSFTPGMNTETMKHYVDFAAAHHLEYMLVDAGWSPGQDEYSHLADITQYKPTVDIPGIVAYAQQKGVKTLIWMHWTSVKKYMDQAFPLYEKWGVAGVKIDFMDRDDQEMVNFYEEMVRKAAQHHLVVDFHGAYKPTGLRRTYPNLLTREGVMGMEYSKWSTRVTPEHDVTIPFTRMLAGPMDYTPGCFSNATRSQFVPRNVEPMCQGTRAHQLAMYVVFESPLVMLSDYPESYDNKPGMEFLEKVPTVWDQTKVLNGEPAKYVTIARQHGKAWYLGAMTNWEARNLELSLDFLEQGEYEAEVFADGANADRDATSLSISKKRVRSVDKLNVHLAPGGGLAVIFTPIK
ncbi:MAG TPA: glycoside hydrolase family 97 protein [Terriglobia bacterium]|nr:glycoside hydrolase family 97 protein [Terriglobia bacterium]